jgi:tetratricopeptide (TPR) repeat protein
MARHQLSGRELDEPLEELVLEKTEGVPFFVEEFLKSLRDLGLLELSNGTYRLTKGFEDVSVPTTIQDVLRARVDLLPDTAKELLKTASVVGREISHALLQQLTGAAEEDLLADLSILKDAELLYERGVYPHSTYLFRHALTQEVVHDSLLQDQRRKLHRKAGEAIESIYRANLVEHYGVLAEHFIAGEDFDKAYNYSRLAARSAHQAGAGPIAIEYAEKSVACVSRLPKSDRTLRQSINARTTLAGYVLFLGRPHEANQVIAPIMDAALALEDHSSWPALFASVGLHELFTTEDYPSAMRHLEKVLETPVDKTSAAWHWFAAYYLGAFLSWDCAFDQSIHYLQRAKAMSETAGRPEGVAVARASIGLALAWQGQLNAASEEIDKALVEATSSHNPTSEALAQAAVGIVRSAQGFHSAAKTHLLQGMKFTGETAQSFWRSLDLGYLGDTLSNLGDYDEAKNRYQESLAILKPAGLVPSWQNVLKLKLARVSVLEGGGGVRLDELREWRQANRLRLFEGLTARLIAEILLAQEETDVDEAHRWLTTAMAADRANRLKLDLAHDYACFAELHRRNADREQMLESLVHARDLFEECGAEGFVEEMDRRLDRGVFTTGFDEGLTPTGS